MVTVVAFALQEKQISKLGPDSFSSDITHFLELFLCWYGE